MDKKYAGFLTRFAAGFIDGLIFSVLSAVVNAGKNNSTAAVLSLVLQLAYAVWMLGAYGATIGKKIMKIKVIKEDNSKLTYSDALVRELSKYLSAAVLLLGYLWVIWDKKKQGWHDKIAKTLVVQA